jgi:hypothetical protein
MRTISHTDVEKIKKNAFYVPKPFPENRACYELMWKNGVQPDNSQII